MTTAGERVPERIDAAPCRAEGKPCPLCGTPPEEANRPFVFSGGRGYCGHGGRPVYADGWNAQKARAERNRPLVLLHTLRRNAAADGESESAASQRRAREADAHAGRLLDALLDERDRAQELGRAVHELCEAKVGVMEKAHLVDVASRAYQAALARSDAACER